MHKVLPGVAYLEMARAAVEQARPGRRESRMLELRDAVWQSIEVTQEKQVSIALWGNEKEEIEFEIYSVENGEETVHGQGRGVWREARERAALDLEQLKGEMGKEEVEARSLYEMCAEMGVMYGGSFQAIRRLQRGRAQVLAELRMPVGVEETWGEYVLHPSMMDGALQAAVGLIDRREGQEGAAITVCT